MDQFGYRTGEETWNAFCPRCLVISLIDFPDREFAELIELQESNSPQKSILFFGPDLPPLSTALCCPAFAMQSFHPWSQAFKPGSSQRYHTSLSSLSVTIFPTSHHHRPTIPPSQHPTNLKTKKLFCQIFRPAIRFPLHSHAAQFVGPRKVDHLETKAREAGRHTKTKGEHV